MSLINIQNLTFGYTGCEYNVFDNLNLQLDTDWKTGLIGRNGRGKTTLLKLLLGKYEYKGVISVKCAIDYFPFEIRDSSMLAINVIDSILPNLEEWKLFKELNLLDVNIDKLYARFDCLSKGEQTKILLAVLFLKENNFLLIDEPTNYLDLDGRRVVGKYLGNKKGFVLVSHDKRFLDSCIDHVVSINRSEIEVCKSNFSDWRENKRIRDESELSENKKLERDIERLKKSVKRTSAWADDVESSKFGENNSGSKVDRGFIGHKSAKMMQRAKAMEYRQNKAIEEKSKLLKNIETAEKLKISALEYRSETIVYAEKISIYYGSNKITDNVSFELKKGSRTALIGKNGSGKSSLLKLITGESIEYEGKLHMNKDLIISYVSQDTTYLHGGIREFASDKGIEETLFRAILDKLNFSKQLFSIPLENLSEGQKKKVLIAASLSEKAHLYVWDEPLNYIDIFTREQIENLLIEFAPALLFVEHDEDFCKKVATDKILLR